MRARTSYDEQRVHAVTEYIKQHCEEMNQKTEQ